MLTETVELRVPVEGTLIINSLGGMFMEKQDRRKQNGGKTKGKLLTAPVKNELKKGPDQYVPGRSFTIAKSVRGRWPVKAAKQDYVCVTKNCTGKTKTRKGKWCDECFPKVRALGMKVNKARWARKHAKKAA